MLAGAFNKEKALVGAFSGHCGNKMSSHLLRYDIVLFGEHDTGRSAERRMAIKQLSNTGQYKISAVGNTTRLCR